MLNNWLLLAFAAPMVWALGNLVDVYLVKEAFKNEYDGVIIFSLPGFLVLPLMALPGFSLPDAETTMLALLSGGLMATYFLFYLRAIFITGDVTLIQAIWNTTAIMVPLLAYFILGEKLSLIQYVGIGVVFLAATILSLGKSTRQGVAKILLNMTLAVAIFSLNMVIDSRVYAHCEFWSGFILIILGGSLAGLVLLLARVLAGKPVGHLLRIERRHLWWLLVANILGTLGTICSHRAIKFTPAVSYIAVIESFMPVFIVVESALLYLAAKVLAIRNNDTLRAIYEEQVVGVGMKFFVVAIMAFGIYLIN